MKWRGTKVQVKERSVVARINRALRHRGTSGQALRRMRNKQWRLEIGDWYVVDLSINGVVDRHVSLDELGRELGVLKPWEEVEERKDD